MRRYSGIGGSRAIGVCLSADPEEIDEELAKRSGREGLMVVCPCSCPDKRSSVFLLLTLKLFKLNEFCSFSRSR